MSTTDHSVPSIRSASELFLRFHLINYDRNQLHKVFVSLALRYIQHEQNMKPKKKKRQKNTFKIMIVLDG